ncbi:flagellar motor switch protein [Oceanicola granulosus HTCC2516]|uniref:Flagellar motor switch protein n=1 Tax=Oceanicola granulosus (strain ATCC BAA-861 / DSM 15982 / KCTC 12143 / HTCC2516) TaxID=314256 RepID=Q2CGH9_OCEGH|nr:FliH/SctL family protein [Oceanicola granulosus]EAR51739.1 flagellar motor switch protein [Oceanicola granulosus HTCC2516]
MTLEPLLFRNFDEPAEAPDAPPAYDAQELEAARQAAYAEGVAAGRQAAFEEAAQSLQAREAATLACLDARLGTLVSEAGAHRAALEEQMLDFVLSVAEQVLPEYVAAHGPARVEAELVRTIRLALGSPLLRVVVAPDTAPKVGARLEAAAAAHDYRGRLEVGTDERLAPGEATAAWETGFMEYSYPDVCDRILAALRGRRPAADRSTPSRSHADA